MTKDEKINAGIGIFGVMAIFLNFLFYVMITPYITVKKAEKGDFKTACAYVVGKKKMKYSYNYEIMIDSEIYYELDILPAYSPYISKNALQEKLSNFPITRKYKDFLKIEPNKCKKIKYIEVYNFLWFKKLHIYDFIN